MINDILSNIPMVKLGVEFINAKKKTVATNEGKLTYI